MAVLVVADVDGQTDTDHGQEIQDGRRGSRMGGKKKREVGASVRL